MPIVINGSGTVTGISVGGLPDGIVDTDMIANNAVTNAKATGIAGGKLLSYVQVESDTDTDLGNSTGGGGTWTTAPSPFDNVQITPTKTGSKMKVVLRCPFYQDLGDLDFGVTASYKIASGSYTRLGHVGTDWDCGLFTGYFNSPGGASDYTWQIDIDYIHTPSSYNQGDVLSYKFEYWTNQNQCHWNGIRPGRAYARIEELAA
jgi:hypothetical protein